MAAVSTTCGGGGASGEVHRCAGKGRWFPADAGQLKASVTKYLNGATFEQPAGEVVAVIAPHAGYPYSGPVAGYSYAAVRDKAYDRVVSLALSHSMNFDNRILRGISVLDVDAYETPLGSIPVDRECVQALLKTGAVHSEPGAHLREHSDENQLPFLQVALKPGWKLVPILVGDTTDADLDAAAKALRPYIFGDTLVVVSSDFTHLQRTNAKEQNRMDLGAAKLVVARDCEGFVDYVEKDPYGQGSICGRRPITLLLKLLDEDCTGHLLKHAISGELTGDFSYSVGYCAIAFTTPKKKPSPAPNNPADRASNPSDTGAPTLQSDKILTPDEEQTLLKLARATLVQWIEKDSDSVDLSSFDLTPALRKKAGAFVTLKSKGRLRGCIGYIEPIKPLYETVIENARNAATKDPRFPAVTGTELPHIHVDISVMSPLRKIDSVEAIVVGRHGLVIEKGFNRGVFLPQVPVEQRWNLQQYLEGICAKANLSPGSWKEGATLYVFSAQVFGEKE